jgi:hypothetical protein
MVLRDMLPSGNQSTQIGEAIAFYERLNRFVRNFTGPRIATDGIAAGSRNVNSEGPGHPERFHLAGLVSDNRSARDSASVCKRS